jgi:hypothetical protein
MPKNPEQGTEGEPTPVPAILDVVKIDGRWAQVIYGGGVVRFLDDNSAQPIEWDDYLLAQPIHSQVRELRSQFTDNEVANIHWGASDPDYLKLEVDVFGEYQRKQ